MSYVSEGIPLRMLVYICEILKGYLPKRDLYDRKQKPIPMPEFFVIYNGKETYPPNKVLRLSDAFIEKPESPNLKLIVPVYNITNGYNKELLEQSTALLHYATIVSCVEKNLLDGHSLDDAIDMAIHYCIEHDIMAEYLTNNNAEVRSMLSFEWDEEVYREALLEEGEERGREEGFLEIARRMKADGNTVDKIAHYTGLSEEVIAAL